MNFAGGATVAVIVPDTAKNTGASPARTAVVGVVGHVDHGKSALVKALTGTDPDRLDEEKARGISIVLGFAHLAVPGGEIELIDMPGHERFVKTMISGATGIDAVLLVVAANEGIRPQTIEHVDIARLIGVRRGIVAVTKCDLVLPAEARRVAAQAQHLISFLPAAPIVLTSAATGEGVKALAVQLALLLADPGERIEHGFFHLPIDRAFAVAGFGTVVTGTLRRGRIAVGDEVELLPGRRRARVRGLQVHNHPVSAAAPGRRVAVNLRGVEKAELRPGDALATPGILGLGRWLDAELHLLDAAPRPLASGDTLRLLLGTTDVGASLRLLGEDRLSPGASAVVQFRCAADVAVPAREPFVIRLPSPPRTIGGGRILHPLAARHRRTDARIADTLRWLIAAESPAIVRRQLQDAGWQGRSLGDLAQSTGFAPSRVAGWAAAAGAEIVEGVAIDGTAFRALCEHMRRAIDGFHRRFPRELGMSPDRLLAALPKPPGPPVFRAAVAHLARQGSVVQEQGRLRRRGVDPGGNLAPADAEAAHAIEEAFRKAGLTPPEPPAAATQHWAVRHLLRRGALIRTVDRVQKREILFHRDAISRARRLIAAHLSGAAGFTVGEAGRVLGISRKYSIPLLEYLDAAGFTTRRGDRRVVSAAAPAAPLPAAQA